MSHRDVLRRPAWLATGAALVLLWLALGAAPAWGDAAAGRAAYDRGDYARALEDWQSAANRGDPDAQFGLGSLYEYGFAGLPQDYKEADHWYQLAAAQDYSEAQYRLALIWAVGGEKLAPDPVEAYKWVILAGESKGIWQTMAGELREQLDKVVSPQQREEATKRATAWRAARTQPAAAAEAAPAAAAPAAATGAPVKPGGCPGWPFPTLPCTEQFPALPGAPTVHAAEPPKPAQGDPTTPVTPIPAAVPPASPPPAAAPTSPALDTLNQALGGIDCAALRARLPGPGLPPIVTGTVPDASAKPKIAALAQRYFPATPAQIAVDIIAPPLCRALAELEAIRRAGLLTDGSLTVRLANGTGAPQLQEGDLIRLEVRGPAYPVSLRIDYYSLDGRVQHLWPNDEEPGPKIAPGVIRVFGGATNGKTWKAGGAPFGVEQISVIATPQPLELHDPRPTVEQSLDYLRDLRRALAAVKVPDKPNIFTSLLVTTHGR